MKLALKGSLLAFTGKIQGYTKRTLTTHIEDAGGSVSSTPHAEVDIFLAGERASQKKIDKVLALGIVVLQGDDLYTLLDKGTLERDEDANKRSFDEIVADVRAVLAQPASRTTWQAIVQLVDACEEDHIDGVVDYIASHIESWPPCVFRRDDEEHFAYEWWYRGLFGDSAGEVRRLPKHWLTEIVNGEQHPKVRLCRALSFSVADLNNTLSAKVFDNPSISHIRVFDIGWWVDQFTKKKTFYKKMARATNLQNVEVLILNRAPPGALDELLKATSLPSLKALHLKRETYQLQEEDKGARLFLGPWAKQLERVEIHEREHYEYLAAHIDELPRLRELLLSVPAYARPAFFEAVTPLLPDIVENIDTIILRTESLETYSGLSGTADILQELKSAHALKTLDMRYCVHTKLSGSSGVDYARKYFVETGLIQRLDTLLVPEVFDAGVCDYLRTSGTCEVIHPAHKDRDKHEVGLQLFEDVEPGEEERRQRQEVHVHDAMMFEAPCPQAWKVLVSVVNGLEQQLSPKAFEEVITTLENYLEAWPDALRRVPTQWYGEYFAPKPSAKLRLPRTFRLQVGSFQDDPKDTSRWLSGFAACPPLKHLQRIELTGFEAQKHMQSAIQALFAAVKPTSCDLRGWRDTHKKKIVELLQDEQLYPQRDEYFQSYDYTYDSNPSSALDQRHVRFNLNKPEDLQTILARTDLDHVVSFELKVDLPWGHGIEFDWSSLSANRASWRRLRYLQLSTSPKFNARVFDAFARWLDDARPVYVEGDFSAASTEPTPILQLLEAGVLARSYGTHITLPCRLTRDEARCLSNPNIRVAGIAMAYGANGYDTPTCTGLLSLMHRDLKRTLRVLCWPMDSDTFEDIEEICEQLPRLCYFAPIHRAFGDVEARKPFLETLAKAKQTRQLSNLQWISAYRKGAKFTAAELKTLKKGEGLHASALGLRNLDFIQWS